MGECAVKVCAVDECDRGPRTRGWCAKHYLRWYRHGDPNITLTRKVNAPCSIDDCERPVDSRGWCHLHYLRWLKHGNPNITLFGGPRCRRGHLYDVENPYVYDGRRQCRACARIRNRAYRARLRRSES